MRTFDPAILAVTLTGLISLAPASDRDPVPVSAPVDLVEPGEYFLTQDVDADGMPAIRVLAEGISLDLNGHVLSARHADVVVAQHGFAVYDGHILALDRSCLFGAGVSGIRVANVDCEATEIGLYVGDGATVEFSSFRAGAGIIAGDDAVIRHNRIDFVTFLDAIVVGDGSQVDNNSIWNTGGNAGICVRGGTSRARIRGNRIRDCGESCIEVRGDAEVVGNTVGPAGPGGAIFVSGTGVVRNNVVDAGNGMGILIRAANAVVESNTVGNADRAFVIEGDDVTLRSNHAPGSNSGFLIRGDRARVFDNSATSHGACGFEFSGTAPPLYRRNVSLGSADGFCGAGIDGGRNVSDDLNRWW